MNVSVSRAFWRRLRDLMRERGGDAPEAFLGCDAHGMLFVSHCAPGRVGEDVVRVRHDTGESVQALVALALREAPDQTGEDRFERSDAPVELGGVFRGHLDFIPVLKAHLQRAVPV